jgi:hypothetical protein
VEVGHHLTAWKITNTSSGAVTKGCAVAWLFRNAPPLPGANAPDPAIGDIVLVPAKPGDILEARVESEAGGMTIQPNCGSIVIPPVTDSAFWCGSSADYMPNQGAFAPSTQASSASEPGEILSFDPATMIFRVRVKAMGILHVVRATSCSAPGDDSCDPRAEMMQFVPPAADGGL